MLLSWKTTNGRQQKRKDTSKVSVFFVHGMIYPSNYWSGMSGAVSTRNCLLIYAIPMRMLVKSIIHLRLRIVWWQCLRYVHRGYIESAQMMVIGEQLVFQWCICGDTLDGCHYLSSSHCWVFSLSLSLSLSVSLTSLLTNLPWLLTLYHWNHYQPRIATRTKIL